MARCQKYGYDLVQMAAIAAHNHISYGEVTRRIVFKMPLEIPDFSKPKSGERFRQRHMGKTFHYEHPLGSWF